MSDVNEENPFNKALAADPAPLGLAGFAFTTFLLSFVNAGLIGSGGVNVVVPLAVAYGGIAQLIAGSWEMRRGNTFGFTAFTSYGAFWEFYALLNILADLHVVTVLPASAIGWSLILWGIFTLYMWIGAMMLNVSLNLTFLTLWLAFVTLGIGAIYSSSTWTHAGGYLGILAAFFAAYTSFAIIINSIRPKTIPVGPGIKFMGR
ncbi:MAG: acetate uptake transporter [Candidatus Thermoplasmatota archaeon]|nr:acetate uptake transporter [Candidatus Thermoplasmatota archaeon]MCL5790354.1 acetate uptake transporter [Candidatus Thermoplasmatota archaeon]